MHQAELAAGSQDLSPDQAVPQPRRVPHHAAGPGPGQNGQTSAPLGTRNMHPAVWLQGSPLLPEASPACTGTAPFLCLAGHRPPRRPRGRAEANVPATAWPPGQMPRDWLPAKRTIVLSSGRRLTTCACTHTHTRIQARTPHTLIPDIHTRTRVYMTIHGHINLRPLRLPVLNVQQDVPGRGLHARLRVPGDKQDQGTAEVRELKNDTRV